MSREDELKKMYSDGEKMVECLEVELNACILTYCFFTKNNKNLYD